jgi:hypothetical protein
MAVGATRALLGGWVEDLLHGSLGRDVGSLHVGVVGRMVTCSTAWCGIEPIWDRGRRIGVRVVTPLGDLVGWVRP